MKRISILLLLVCAACTNLQVQPHLPPSQQPQLTSNALVTSDGAKLPLRAWLPKSSPQAVIIALHGMNDYSHAFEMPGTYLSKQGIAVYAYDQRGFGATANTGIWAGEDNLTSDLSDMIRVLRQRHPGKKLFVIGESMGGAVAITAFSRPGFPQVDGVVLSAPAVWGGGAMNPIYRASLWLLAHAMPDKILTGQGLRIQASDNIPMLRELGKDPLVIKRTRADSILGLVRLMDKGQENLRTLGIPVFVIYGKHDEVIPPEAVAAALRNIKTGTVFALYPKGYHLLLRDLSRDVPNGDIAAWIKDTPLPSGHRTDIAQWQQSLAAPEPSTGKSSHRRKAIDK